MEKEMILKTLRKKFVNSSLINKTCSKCKETYPRDDQHFYSRPHRSNKDVVEYRARCIRCENERTSKWHANNKKDTKRVSDTYRNSERGYFMAMWQSTKISKHGHEFKDFDDFFSCWVEQQKIYETKCPYLNIEMTKIKGGNLPGVKIKPCRTNISRDRIDSSLPYSRRNLMFCSWEANATKGSVTPKIAKKYLVFYKERYGTDEVE